MGMFDGITNALSGVIGDIGGGDILKAGASLLGGSSANQKSWDIAMATNTANAQQAQISRDWQERMRSTQYQTAVDDLMKAGLNPMLAYTQGGAGTPPGATATAVPAQVKDAITPAVHTALAASSNRADITLKDEQAKATSAQTAKTNADAIKTIADTAKSEQDTKTSAAAEEVNKAQLNSIAADIALKNQQKITSSAQAGLTAAETINTKERNPPWWERLITDKGASALEMWKNKVQESNKYLKGK